MWGGVAADPILVSIPMFIFMGAMLERSGLAKDLLGATEILLERVPGGLAVAVMLMGTIIAAPIGVVGAAVVMLSLIALPHMLAAGYNKQLALGTVASAGTLGILMPPAIMLVVMADLLHIGRNPVRRRHDPGTAAVRTLSDLYHARCDSKAEARARSLPDNRTADKGRVLARHVVWSGANDVPDGPRAGLDLRGLGDGDRERGHGRPGSMVSPRSMDGSRSR